MTEELDRRFFRDRYNTASEAERIYMAAMADLGSGSHSSAAIAAHMGKAAKQLSVRRDGLLKKGLIYSRSTRSSTSRFPLRAVHPPHPPIRRVGAAWTSPGSVDTVSLARNIQ